MHIAYFYRLVYTIRLQFLMVTEDVVAAQESHQSCTLLTLELTPIHPTHTSQGYVL